MCYKINCNLTSLSRIENISNDKLINLLKYYKLINLKQHCPHCNYKLNINKDTRYKSIGYSLFCKNKNCKKRYRLSLFKNSFFNQQTLNPRKILQIIILWVLQIQPTTAANLLNLDSHTVIRFFELLRKICNWKFTKTPIILGGKSIDGKRIIVQCDESVITRAKYNRGRNLNKNTKRPWVFGMYDTYRKIGYVTLVHNRNRPTLTNIIKSHLFPKSIIFTDEHKGYYRLPKFISSLDIWHETV